MNWKYHLYGQTFKDITHEELIQWQKENPEFVARAENSGSESCYVEIARWHPKKRWCRFAFAKVLDFDRPEDNEDMGDVELAERLADEINEGDKRICFIHSLPNYEDESV